MDCEGLLGVSGTALKGSVFEEMLSGYVGSKPMNERAQAAESFGPPGLLVKHEKNSFFDLTLSILIQYSHLLCP